MVISDEAVNEDWRSVEVTDNKPTLREEIVGIFHGFYEGFSDYDRGISDLCDILEDTGFPAHMWVARELRGTDTADES